MAEGQGINWGGMIKGAVKIAAYVTVGIGIVAGAALGVSAIPGAEGTIWEPAVKGGAAVAGWVTGASETVANALSAPVNGIIDIFTGANTEPTNVGGEKLVEQAALPEGVTAEMLQAPAEGVVQTATAMVGETGSLTTTIDNLDKAIEAVKATGADTSTLETMKQQAETLKGFVHTAADANASSVTSNINTVLEKAAPFAGNEGNLQTLEGQLLQAQHGITDADQLKLFKDAETALDGVRNSASSVVDNVNDMRGELSHLADKIQLPNAPLGWAAAGAAVLGTKAVHRMGEAKGQREVVGAFTQAEMDRRGAAARMAGMGPTQG